MNRFSITITVVAIILISSLTSSADSKISPIIERKIDKLNELSSSTRSEDGPVSDLTNHVVRVDDNGNIQVNVHCTEISNENLLQLADLGLDVEIVNDDLKIVQGWMSPGAIEEAAGLEFVDRVTPPSYAHTRVGSVQTQGDAVMMSDTARSTFNVDGTGVTILVISDSVETIAASQATGDLPGSIMIGDPGDPVRGINEGTAMLEIVHDVAPGADLAFHTAFPTAMTFINAIDYGIGIGADIIVDDIGFLLEPYFQDGSLAQKAQEAVDAGIVFVSSAGNDADRHYQAFYTDDGGLDPDDDLHDFGAAAGGASNVGMTIAIPGSVDNGRAVIFLQWSDPFGASSNNYDLFLVDSNTFAILASSTILQNGNDDPIEIIDFENTSPSMRFADIVIRRSSGTAQTLEMHFLGNHSITEFNVPADSIYGHPATEGVIATAAFWHAIPNTIEDFSSHGPSSLISPNETTTVSSTTETKNHISIQRNKPDIAGPDGVSTTVPGFGTFFGTSAAAPHVAAVAALIIEEIEKSQSMASFDPTIATRNVSTVRTAITSTAVDLGTPGFDFISGFGRINAFAAVQSVVGVTPSPTPTTSSSPSPTASPSASPSTSPTATPNEDSDNNNTTGCAIAGSTVQLSTTLANLLIPLVPGGFAFALRARRKKK